MTARALPLWSEGRGPGDAGPAGPGQRGRQDALAGQREHVPPGHVVIRQRGGEQRGHEQRLRRLRQRAAGAEPVQQPRPLRRRGGGHVRPAGVGLHRPGRGGVQRPDGGQRGVGGGGNRPPRVAGLLAQHRGLLEPDERQPGDHGEHPERPGPGRGQGRGRQRPQVQVPAGRGGEPGDGLGDDDGDLGGGQHGQDPAGDLDPGQAQDGDHGPDDQRPRPPGPVHAEVGGGLGLRGRAQRPVGGDLERLVGDQGHQRGGDPGHLAEPGGGERVERARVADPPAHRHVPGAEQGQDHGHDEEGGRDAGQAGEGVRGRDHPGRHRHRRDGRQDEREHGEHAELVPGQRPGHRAGPGRGRVHGHEEPP